MIYLVLFLFIVGLIIFISSNHEITKELRSSLSPYEIEMIDEELKNRKYVGQVIILLACFITVFYIY